MQITERTPAIATLSDAWRRASSRVSYTTIASPAVALLYILIFGVGSIGGMMMMSFLIGLPIHLTANRFEFLNKGIRLVAGLFSLGLGTMIVFEKLASG